jgi:F-type H+-transporting ATPase subunit a
MIDIAEAGRHVIDSKEFQLPLMEPWHIPQPFGDAFPITKYMVLELVAVVLMLLVFIPLARRIRTGKLVKGRFWNLFEAFLLFIRNEMARPAIGGRGADKYLPFLWTAFFFILCCNLLGLLPWAGSPTGSLAVTAALAGMTAIVVVGSGIQKFGAVGFWLGLVPRMEMPLILLIPLWPFILFIEVFGLAIKHLILAIRLLANMFAGHLVLAVMLSFIKATADIQWLWWGVTPATIAGATAMNLLELFVAFLQAYIFTFLSALFIGMAVHQH